MTKIKKMSWYKYIILMSMFLMMACGGEQKKWRSEIIHLEQAAEKTPDDKTLKALISKYLLYIDRFPKDKEWCAAYLYRTAQLYYRVGNMAEAIKWLDEADANYPKAANNADVELLTISIYDEELYDFEMVERLCEAFLKKHPTHPKASMVKDFNRDIKTKLEERIKTYTETLKKSSYEQPFNTLTAEKLMKSYEWYVKKVPSDTLTTVEYMTQAAKMAEAANLPAKAASLWLELATRYPKTERAGDALFRAAFIYDDKLKSLDLAKTLYQRVLNEYPKSDLADDAGILLKNLGKTAEELIQNNTVQKTK